MSKKVKSDKLVIANTEKSEREAELVIANTEKSKREAELVIANKQKAKREAELVIAKGEKEKRANELIIANIKKEKRADELIIANKELVFQNREKEKHGGKIWVESEEGKGSVFYFTIPYNAVSEEKIEIVNAVSTEHKEVQAKKLKILIVKDDEVSSHQNAAENQ